MMILHVHLGQVDARCQKVMMRSRLAMRALRTRRLRLRRLNTVRSRNKRVTYTVA